MFLMVMLVGCGTSEMKSTWCDRTISIDGVDSGAEWENARYFFEKEKVTVGVMNTESILYLRLSTYDQRLQRQILALGFTIWFDEKGGDKKVLGIHYPLRGQGAERPMMRSNQRIDMNSVASQIDTLVQSIPNEIELIGPGKGERSPISFVDAQKYGILCKIGDAKGNLVYELQFPLQRTDACPYGISAKQVKAIGIDFEAGKMNSSQMGQRREGSGGRGGMGPGGMGGGGRGGMGGMGGMGGGMGRRGGMGGGGMGGPVQEPLELKVKVDLAKNPADSAPKS